MKKPIFAIKLVGVLIDEELFKKAHILWFEDISKQLDRPDIRDWGYIYSQEDNYFFKVDEAMKLKYPKLNRKERIIEAKRIFFEYVLKHIKKSSNVVNSDVVKEIRKKKEKYTIALISTSQKEYLIKILKKLEIFELFDIIEATDKENIDNRREVYNCFCKKYSKPVKYVTKIEELFK